MATRDESLMGVLDHAGVGSYIAAADGAILSANPSFAALVGQPVAKGSRIPWIVRTAERLAHGETISRTPDRWQRADTTFVDVIETALLADGVIQGIVEDVTEERRAERGRVALEQAYHRVVDNLPDALMIDDEAGRVVFANDRFLELFGLSRAELRSVQLENYVAPEFHASLRDRHQRRLRGEDVPSHFEYVGIHKNGRRMDLEVRVVPVMEDGDCVGTQSVVRDVTERKEMERNLAEANETLRRLVEALPMAVHVLNRHGIVLTWNPAAERMFGWTKEEVTGRPYPCVSDDERASFQTLLASTFESEITRAGVELKRRRKDGSVVDVAIWTTPLRDASGQVTASIGVVADIGPLKRTERELKILNETLEKQVKERTAAALKAEEKLRHAQKMDAVGRLAGGVAHDFNNLLMAILGFSELAVEGLPPVHPIRASIGEVTKAANRGATLVKQLLAFSRRDVSASATFDINARLESVRQMLQRLVREDITVSWVLGPNLPLVKLDPSQLDQAVLNLVVNARDAMPNGGRLAILTRRATAPEIERLPSRTSRAGSYVVLEVTDTGVGMDAETLAHLFEPFFTTKPVGRGTGLGLSTVYGLVEHSGGHVEVESTPGVGSSFRIYLPEAEGVATSKAASRVIAVPREGKERILLVEDDEAVRNVALTALRSHGYTVTTATCGTEGLTAFSASPSTFDLVITDVIMPGMTGRQMAEKIRELRPVPILFMSGYIDDERVRKGVMEEGQAFLRKPFGLRALWEAVRGILDASAT